VIHVVGDQHRATGEVAGGDEDGAAGRLGALGPEGQQHGETGEQGGERTSMVQHEA
jgi:hypothetical protein